MRFSSVGLSGSVLFSIQLDSHEHAEKEPFICSLNFLFKQDL